MREDNLIRKIKALVEAFSFNQPFSVYLREHFRAAGRAIDEGVPLRGYFVWSFMDNFEWAEGYSKRFGVVRVDFETLERTVKDSGWFLKDVIASNSVPEEGD